MSASSDGPGRAVIHCPRYPHPPVSGGVKRTLRLIEALDRAGSDVHVVTPDAGGLSDDADAASRPWRTHVLAAADRPAESRARVHLRRLPYERRAGAEVARLAAGAAFAQFEGHNSAPFAARVRATPVVYSTHNVDSQIVQDRADALRAGTPSWLRTSYKAAQIRYVERVTSRRAAAVLCVSDDDAAAFEPLAGRVIVAPNGVDDAFFTVSEETPPGEDVVFFGQFTYEPNLHGIERFLREGWPRLAAARPEARLLIAGEQSVERLGRSPAERVEVLGLVDDLTATLAAARAVVVPIWQGGGTRLKVLESLATGRPVVGTTLGVAGTGFVHDRHGLVADEPAGLADLTAQVLADPGRATALGAGGRELARRFAWRRALAPAEELYRELLERHRDAGRGS